MIELVEEDYTPIDKFRLAWRWMDKRYNVLPEDVLATIRPLKEEKAHEIFQRTRVFNTEYGFREGTYRLVDQIVTARKRPSTVQRWLRRHINGHDEQVIASWQRELAVVTTNKVFCDYWGDFCYSASDDIAIVPLTEEWHLTWWHEEMFFIGHEEG